MPEHHKLLAAIAFSRMRKHPTILDTMIQDEVQEGVIEVTDAIMKVQADVQSALGLLRMQKRGEGLGVFPDYGIEGLLDDALTKAHALLGSLGRPMPPRKP